MVEIVKIKYQKQFKCPAINAGEVYEIPIPQSSIDEHHFFNDLTITNLDSVDIEVTPDGDSDRTFPVVSKSEKNWSFKNDNMKFSRIKVTNLGAVASTANKIILVVLKKRVDITKET